MNPLLFFEKFGIEKRRIIAAYAKICLGKDLDNTVANEFACAISVNNIVKEATGEPIGGGASTYLMYKVLLYSPRWRQIHIWDAEAGDIIIAPTGMRTAPSSIENGHVGILGDSVGAGKYPKKVMSNNSLTGKWDEHYTLGSFFDRYARIGKYQIFVYRLIF